MLYLRPGRYIFDNDKSRLSCPSFVTENIKCKGRSPVHFLFHGCRVSMWLSLLNTSTHIAILFYIFCQLHGFALIY